MKSFIHPTRVFLVAVLFCVIFSGWKGTFRTKDVEVFKLWLPFVHSTLGAGETSGASETSAEATGKSLLALTPVGIEQIASASAGALGSPSAGSFVSSLFGGPRSPQRVEIEVAMLEGSSAAGNIEAGVSQLSHHRTYAIVSADAATYSVEILPSSEVKNPVAKTAEDNAQLVSLAGGQGLQVAGQTYMLEKPEVAAVEKGTAAQVFWAGLAEIAPREFLSVVTTEKNQAVANQTIVLLRLPSSGPQGTAIKGLPLVNLTELGLSEPVQSLALLNDSKTILVLPKSVKDHASAPGYPLWLVRLPGALKIPTYPIYLAAGLAVLVSVVLLMFGLKRGKAAS